MPFSISKRLVNMYFIISLGDPKKVALLSEGSRIRYDEIFISRLQSNYD